MRTKALLALLIVIGSCSSSGPKKKEMERVDNKETMSKDFVVRNASSRYRPTWIEDPIQWAINEELDRKKYRYFSFETDAKGSREMACNLATANAKANVAGEITSFITKNLGASQQGEASIDHNNPEIAPIREYVETTLTEKVQGLIVGASIINTYWEKRNYLEKLGAVKNYIGYTCAVLVRMDSQRLDQAMNLAMKEVLGQAGDPDSKETVKKALEKANEEYKQKTRGDRNE